MDINNLTNVYNQNPTLQGSYTLQQYLDLFGGNSTTTPPTPDPTPTPTPTPPDQGIINANINQFQRDSGGIPSSPMGLTQDFMTATENRQKRLTNPNKATQFFNKITGGGQTDIGEMIRTGQIDTRKTSGIPFGISGLIAKAMPDKYYDMSLEDQVFTQSQMGYDGPTVFGENNMSNKDPFGLNVRSAFGNYGEAVGENFNQLKDTLTKNRGAITFNKETGMFEGDDQNLVDIENKKTKMIRNKYLFRQKQLGVKDKLNAQIKAEKEKQIKAAEKNKKEQQRKEQAEKDRLASLVGQTITTGGSDGSTSIVQTESGGNDRGTSRPSDHSRSVGLGSNAGNVRSANRAGRGSAQSYNQNLARGGVVSLKNGGATNGSSKAALSAKVKELMDDGYEFGEAVKEAMKQGYMNGGRIKSYFKGGLVSLRGR